MSRNLSIYSWDLPSGSYINIIYEEFKYFKNRGYNVKVVFYECEPKSYQKNKIDEMNPIILKNFKGQMRFFSFFKIKPINSDKNIPLDAFYLASNFFKKTGDYIIIHKFASGITLLPYAMMNKGKILVFIHDNIFLDKGNNLRSKIASTIRKEIVKLSASFFTLIATNEAISRILSKNIKKQHIIIASFGIKKCESLPNINLRSEILVVTKWRVGRNPEKYIEIAKLLGKNYKVVIAGQWDDPNYLIKIKDKIAKLNENLTNIELKTDLTDDELHNLYHKCRVFLRLGFGESGVGYGLIDAIGHGCPLIIGKNLGGLDMIIDGIHGYIVDDENLPEITSKILKIMNDDKISEFFSEKVLKLAQEYSWERHGSILENALFGGKNKDE